LHNCVIDFSCIDSQTQEALLAFKAKVVQKYPVSQALLFGNRVRRNHHSQSDADVAIVFLGKKGRFLETKLEMANWAVEVLMDKEVLIQPLSLWESDWSLPEDFPNPYLI
jgi:predicted nucleotidyltransferase